VKISFIGPYDFENDSPPEHQEVKILLNDALWCEVSLNQDQVNFLLGSALQVKSNIELVRVHPTVEVMGLYAVGIGHAQLVPEPEPEPEREGR
jgi:hypothetical protein